LSARLALALTLALLLLAPIGALMLPTVTAQAQQPGPATDRIIWKRYTPEEVPEAFRAGELDVYIAGWAIRPTIAQELALIPGVKLYTAPAGLINFGLNPSPVMIVNVTGRVFEAKEDAAAFLGVAQEHVPNYALPVEHVV
jgi:peptide/nickel transport system substrate-binding protein